MTQKRHTKLSSYVRFSLMVLGLLLLQWNVPVQSCSELHLTGDLILPEKESVKPFTVCRELLADASQQLAHLQQFIGACISDIEEPAGKKSFRIVKVTSVQSQSKKLWPVSGSISSGYGMRRHPVTRRHSFHNGIDIRARKGTGILSPADGIVVSAGRAGLMGRMVKIKTRAGKVLYFGHLNKISCRKGDKVRPGQLLGTVGSSGRATGPHLHFSVAVAGRYINPLQYLSGD
ncbi:MAG TPA: M23 family metallopeptidase [Candidatus Rifleibacterium sp.]|nr:M23 family metallopeptidase [Candidatus Rifleibacterium sp.]HPT45173.1 M23 family metallopeptidase [Candidatus Rifleibacterium sp.]